MPHLYLVDGSGYIFRAYHVLPKLTNQHGEPAGAVYGYTTMLWKLAKELHEADGPTHLAVILDARYSKDEKSICDFERGSAHTVVLLTPGKCAARWQCFLSGLRPRVLRVRAVMTLPLSWRTGWRAWRDRGAP